MGFHLHAGVLDFAVFFAFLLIANFVGRWIAAKNADNSFGKALGALV